ncbi:hypothetical protein KI688_002679, partial [Linnemannia hyalina]
QGHTDTLDGNDAEAEADADTVYKGLSLLAKFEAAVSEAGELTVQSNLRTQSLGQPLSPSPIHILCDGAGGRVSALLTPTLEAVETNQSNSGTTGGSRGSVNLSAAQSDTPTNSRSNSTIFSSKSKPFHATFSTNTGGFSSTRSVETTDSLQKDALPHVNDDIVAAGNDDDRVIDVGCLPSADGGPMALPASYRDGVTDGPSAPFESRTSPLPVPTAHLHSQHIESPLQQQQQQQQQQKRQQNQHQQTNNHPRDAEDNAMSMVIHHKVDNEIIQSRMDIEHRRQTYNSTQQQQHHHLHLPPFPPAVAKTAGSNSKMTMTTRGRVSNMPPFDRQHRFARRDYTSPTYLEDFVLTRRGSINDKNWTTSLTPRATVLPFKLAIDAQKQALKGLKTSDAAPPSESSPSPERNRWLPESSPGHEIHPPTEPGPVYGVNRPKFTHRHAMYDVPFYGIENVEISSSRYRLLTQLDSTKALGEADEGRNSSGVGVGVSRSGYGREVGDEGEGGWPSPLSDHREHIWSIAHEDEYGPETGAGAVEENMMLRERLKRAQVILPVLRPMPPAISPTSGSGSGSRSGEAQLRQGYRGGGGAKDLRIDVEQGSQVEFSQMTVSSSASRSTNATKSNSVQLIPMSHHGHGHGQVPRRPRKPRAVSEGVYGPDTFQESLELLKYVPERPRGWRAKTLTITQQHWKTWLCVGTMFVAAIVLPLVLIKKKDNGSGSNEAARVGQGGEDLGFEGRATVMATGMESSGGDGRKTVVTKTAKPSSTRSVTATTTSTSVTASASSSRLAAAPTSKATTAKRSTTARTSSRRRSKVTRTATSRPFSRTVAPTRTSTSRASSPTV